ncbi:hypothetical protein KW496_00610 [Vibrio fluvialis]|nr:hypothetical protein [Vibrio fluvialis]
MSLVIKAVCGSFGSALLTP